MEKKNLIKKGLAIVLSAAMVLGIMPSIDGNLNTVQAAEGTAPSSEYWTDAEGLKNFGISSTKTIGKIKFGAGGRLWAICGVDTYSSLALLSTSEFAQAEYGSTSKYSDSNFVKKLTIDSDNYLSTSYFSSTELGKMADVTVSTNEPNTSSGGIHSVLVENKKLYLPNSQDQSSFGQTTIYVGSSNDIAIDVKKLNDVGLGSLFWLRSPRDVRSYSALVAGPGGVVCSSRVDFTNAVVPAFNLNLSDVSFASAAEAASSSYTGFKANDTDNTMTANTYTLRYASAGSEEAVISSNGTKIEVTGANGKYLMVQNSTGVYAMAIDSDSKTVNASDITMGSALDNFNNCKVWIESTDADRITTAKMATKAATPSTYKVTVTTDGNGTAVANITTAASGTKVTLTASPKDGYQFKEWQVSEGGVTITNNGFTMPAGNVSVKAIFEKKSAGNEYDNEPAGPSIVEDNEPAGPSIVGDNGTTGWDAIKDKTANATAGSTITVDMNGTTKVPGAVIDSIKGKDVNVVFDLGNGIKWTVNGQSVTKDGIGEIDFGVTTGTKAIPIDVVNEVTGERYSIQISLAYNGEFGFTATLSINMDAKNAGYYANLFYYNKSTGKLEFMNAGKIDGKGNVELTFTHASDYTIVVSDKVMDGSDKKSPKTGDDSPILLWVLALIGSGVGITVVTSKKRKKETR